MPFILRLAAWAAAQRGGCSVKAIESAKAAIEDVLACAIAGADDDSAIRVRNAIAAWGAGRAHVIGGGLATAPLAALANGTAAHALDFDDLYLPGANHASAVLVPALLALAEERGATGQDVVDAYIVGLEMQHWLAMGVMRSHSYRGWHTTSTIGCIGAAGACAHLLHLSETEIGHALSLGVSMASGLKVQFGSMAKPLHAGLAAQHAIQAAVLAESGVQGRLDALEGEMGFLELYGGPEASGWKSLEDKIGSGPLAIEGAGLSTKYFPCCGAAHRVLDSLLELRNEVGFAPDAVERIVATVGYLNFRNLKYDKPQTPMEARFSMQYCAAVAVLNGAVRLADFTAQAIGRPEFRAFLGRTKLEHHAASDEAIDPSAAPPHVVEIFLKDGRRFHRARKFPKGSPADPLSEAERISKFEDCTRSMLSQEQARSARAIVAQLEQVGDVRMLLSALKASPHG